MIQLSHINKTFFNGESQTDVLRDVSLTINKGEYVCIRGESGSGKSTLLNILGCLDKQTSGRYILQGKDLSFASENKLSMIRSRYIGFIFQRFHLLPTYTALRNVELPLIYAGIQKTERINRARKALTSMGLSNRTHHKPAELSGGQQQRVAIARCIVNKPQIIIADEPTGSLDRTASNEVMNIFDHLHRAGTTIILVTHDATVSMRAQRIIKIEDGVLVA